MPDILVDDSFEDLTGNGEKPKKRKQKEPKKKEPKSKAQDAPAEVGGAEDAGEKKRRFGRAGKEGKADNPDNAEKAGGKSKAARSAAVKSNDSQKKGVLFKTLVIVIPVLLVGAFVFEEISYNKLGVRDKAGDLLTNAVIWLDPQHDSARRTLRVRSDELDKREAELNARDANQNSEFETRMTALNERKAGLDVREDEIIDREIKVDERSASLDKREQDMNNIELDRTPIYRRSLSEQEIADMEALSGTFAAMAPASAADILMRMYDPADVATIIYYMSQKNAAAVMAALDPAYAANLTQLLMAD